MKASSGLFLGAAISLPVIAVSWLGNAAWGFPFVPFDIFEWLARIAPGTVITTGIDAMVWVISRLGLGPTSVAAKLAEQTMALGFFAGCSALLGWLIARIAGVRSHGRAIVAGLAVAAVWIGLELIACARLGVGSPWGIVWIVVLLLGWGAVVGSLVHGRAARASEPRAARRRFLLVALGGAAGVSALALGFASLFRRRTPKSRVTPSVTSAPERSVVPVHGTRPEITPNDRFYRIDINLRPPEIDAASWRLVVEGLVERRLSLTLDDLQRMPAVSQMITLECISNRVGGDLIGTSLWTGVRLRDVLDRAGMLPAARAIRIAAADGFYESVGGRDLDDEHTLLVYAMNGEPLPAMHGFPLRIYIPNRHGMKQPKWITRLVASDREGPGYWVDRGWSATAIPNTTAVIDTVGTSMMLADARVVPVGGIAYAGARGISRVEVQVDRGAWNAAKLVAPPLSQLTWVLWRYDWPYTRGRHEFRVRAYDGAGRLQAIQDAPPHPSGATGIHSLVTTV